VLLLLVRRTTLAKTKLKDSEHCVMHPQQKLKQNAPMSGRQEAKQKQKQKVWTHSEPTTERSLIQKKRSWRAQQKTGQSAGSLLADRPQAQ